MKDSYEYFFREFHDQYGCKVCIKDGIEFNTYASDHTDEDQIIHLMNEHGIQTFGISQTKESIERHDKRVFDKFMAKQKAKHEVNLVQ